MIPRTSPESERDLLERAERLAGRTFAEIALELGTRQPSDLKRAKGWIGELRDCEEIHYRYQIPMRG